MKIRFVMAALSAAVLAAACSTDSDRPGPVERQEITLAIEGANAGDLSSVLVVMADAYAMADGVKIPAQIDQARADLALAGQRITLRLQVPPTAENVQFNLELDDFGAFVAGSGAGQVDTRGALIRFTAPVAKISNGAVLRLDLSRSIVPPSADKRVLLPHFDLVPR